MANFNKLFNNFTLLINSIVAPAFVFDGDNRIVKMNTPLTSIMKKANMHTGDINIDTILKVNGCNMKIKKEHLRKNGITVMKYGQRRVIHVAITSDRRAYCGGIMIIAGKQSRRYSVTGRSFPVLSKQGIENKDKQLFYKGKRYNGLKDILNKIEKEFIQQTLNLTNNRSEAITVLGVSRRTFYYKIRKYRL